MCFIQVERGEGDVKEKGFVYPLTVILCFLVCTIVFQQINTYLTEKHFVYEQERIMQLESILQVSVNELKFLESDDFTNGKYIFSYDPGTVTLEVLDFQEGLSTILVRATLKTGHERQAGFLYNWEQGLVENYWEGSYRATSFLHYWVYGFG
ncbi:hypothetical protein GN156_02370 [bacterium LRH843]|nr:hypothetical protein [bacterium LRH843]